MKISQDELYFYFFKLTENDTSGSPIHLKFEFLLHCVSFVRVMVRMIAFLPCFLLIVQSVLKLLLRELQDRLYQLETNQHKYYRMGSFLSMDGYSKWRSKQLSYVKRLIRRFWKNDLPGYLGMQVSGVNTHEEYKILQEKLFK